MSNIVFKLNKIVEAHGVELKELSLRELTTKDIVDAGFPFKMKVVEGEQETEINQKAFVKLASALAGVPGSTITSLSVQDYIELQGIIMGFFGQTTDV